MPTVRELFDFVTDPAINDENMEAVLEALSESAEAQAVELKRVNAQLNALNSRIPTRVEGTLRRIRAGDGVEKGSNCRRRRERHRSHGASRGTGDSGQRVPPGVHPRRPDEVDMFERDQRRLIQGKGESEGIYYQTITGMESDLSGVRTTPTLLTTKISTRTKTKTKKKKIKKLGDSDDESDGRRRFEKPVLDKEAAKAERKAAAKLQKQAAAEKRKTKVPKKVKKAKTKKGKK